MAKAASEVFIQGQDGCPESAKCILSGGSQRPMFNDALLLFIHEPARLVLLTTLAAVNKADFVFLLNSTELSRGNLSVQMTKLQEKGLVKVDKTFEMNRPRTVYQITPAGRSTLKRYRQEMLDILDSLKL